MHGTLVFSKEKGWQEVEMVILPLSNFTFGISPTLSE